MQAGSAGRAARLQCGRLCHGRLGRARCSSPPAAPDGPANIASLNASGFQSGSVLAVDTTGGSTTVSGAIGGNERLSVQGGNVLTLTANNAYTGGTTINAGTLALAPAGMTGIIRGNLTINSGATVAAAAAWGMGWGDNGSPCVSTVAINGGMLAFSGTTSNGGGMAASSVTMTGGAISGDQTPDWYTNNVATNAPTLTTNASTATAVISSGFNLRLTSSLDTLTFNVARGNTASGVDLLVSGPITESQYPARASRRRARACCALPARTGTAARPRSAPARSRSATAAAASTWPVRASR